jgi:hypothetical protein
VISNARFLKTMGADRPLEAMGFLTNATMSLGKPTL